MQIFVSSLTESWRRLFASCLRKNVLTLFPEYAERKDDPALSFQTRIELESFNCKAVSIDSSRIYFRRSLPQQLQYHSRSRIPKIHQLLQRNKRDEIVHERQTQLQADDTGPCSCEVERFEELSRPRNCRGLMRLPIERICVRNILFMTVKGKTAQKTVRILCSFYLETIQMPNLRLTIPGFSSALFQRKQKYFCKNRDAKVLDLMRSSFWRLVWEYWVPVLAQILYRTS